MSQTDRQARAEIEKAMRDVRHEVAQAGPYRVVSCANDTYRVERERVRCEKHERPPKEPAYCEECAMAGQGLLSRISLAEAIEAVLNSRKRRA